MNGNFDKDENREMILDIIYDYLDVYEAVAFEKMSTEEGGARK